MQMSQTFLNLLNAQHITNHHLYNQVQQSVQTQQSHISALQQVTETNTQCNYDHMCYQMVES